MEKIKLQVEGMSCGHCKSAVESALKEAGAADAVVDLEAGTVDVQYDENKIEPAQLQEAIEEAGYDVV
jgi:copper chaperone